MACSLAGGIALVALCVAVALNVTALVLPLWSTTSFAESDVQSSVQQADLTAGVWGFCTDARVKAGASGSVVSFDQCFCFHVASSVALPALVGSPYVNTSVCSGYEATDANATARQAFVATFAALAAQDETAIAAFLDRSCGALGYSSLAFELAAPIAGLLGLLALLVSVACSAQRKQPLASATGKALVLLAFLCAALALVLWIPQAHPLQDARFGGGLVLGVLAIALYLNALALVARHEKGSARGPAQDAGGRSQV